MIIALYVFCSSLVIRSTMRIEHLSTAIPGQPTRVPVLAKYAIRDMAAWAGRSVNATPYAMLRTGRETSYRAVAKPKSVSGAVKLESEKFLSAEEERTLLEIARAALNSCVSGTVTVDVGGFALTPVLKEGHGAFVTLRKAGELRGCIGVLTTTKPLAQAVHDSAISSAQKDPRFASVTPDELDLLSIEVSALANGDRPGSPFIEIESIDQITVGRDGLYIERGDKKGGLFLPQVAVEQGWETSQFLDALCRKAGLPPKAWEEDGTKLHRFTAQVFSEQRS